MGLVSHTPILINSIPSEFWRKFLICKTVQYHLQKSSFGINLLSIVIRQFSWRTVVKQERRFMLKLSRMLAMLSLREMMTVLNMAVVQLKMLQVQARMDLNLNHRGRLLILRQVSQQLRVNPVKYMSINQVLIGVIIVLN
ncbi:hypothetical protein HanRHA438_Chr13g0579141 [Helianthus annuus]|nr:hypothetical protein HanRHA438_Chr13g0579141 [Helianthus annuus]